MILRCYLTVYSKGVSCLASHVLHGLHGVWCSFQGWGLVHLSYVCWCLVVEVVVSMSACAKSVHSP